MDTFTASLIAQPGAHLRTYLESVILHDMRQRVLLISINNPSFLLRQTTVLVSAAPAVVVQDVAPAEAFGSVAAALKALSATTDAVFSKIEHRVADERSRLSSLNDRLTRARERIRQMTG